MNHMIHFGSVMAHDSEHGMFSNKQKLRINPENFIIHRLIHRAIDNGTRIESHLVIKSHENRSNMSLTGNQSEFKNDSTQKPKALPFEFKSSHEFIYFCI